MIALNVASIPILELHEELRAENAILPDLVALHQIYERKKLCTDYSVRYGVLLYRNMFYIGQHSRLIPHLVHEAHATPTTGHGGVKRTLIRLASTFFLPKMRETVEKYISICLICQQTKYSTLPVPNQVWEDLTMDFITGFPTSHQYSAILAVVDRLTKYAHSGPLPAHFTASSVTSLFVDMVVKYHGFPASIISDRDPIFLNKFWHYLFRLSGTALHYSSTYHPQTNGQTEVINQGLEQYLRAFTHLKPSTWANLLNWE